MPPAAAKPDILVVDDTPANVALLAEMLKGLGCRVRVATGGEAALGAAANTPPDLILLDITMPDIDGFEVCRRLKADEKLREVPVVFLSALSDTADKVKAFALGGADYICKPFQYEEVRARVEMQLTLKTAREFLKEKNRFLEYTFTRFVSPKVVETMKLRPITEFLKMERCEVTVLFADLRGFTALAGGLTPEEVQETLNSFLEVMVARIEVADGLMDKFLGDGFMALFGAPFRQADHARRALDAAAAIQQAHSAWLAQRKAAGRPGLPLGIGVAAGEAVVGAYGTRNRMEYTALGQVVNLASRLCGAAAAGEILTTAQTVERSGLSVAGEVKAPGVFSFTAASKGKLTFKNITEPLEVFSISKRG